MADKPNLRERMGRFFLGDDLDRAAKQFDILSRAYFDGPWELPPEELIRQLGEYESSVLTDLVQQLEYETLSAFGYDIGEDAERDRAVKECVYLWKYNPLAQWSIWLWTNYGLGESVVVQVPDNEAADEAVQEFWTAEENQSVLAQDRIHFLSNWLLVKGNQFFAFYGSEVDGSTQVRRVKTEQISEIITHPEDDSVPLFYKRVWTPTKEGKAVTWYYPDFRAFFGKELDANYVGDKTLAEYVLPERAIRADQVRSNAGNLGKEADAGTGAATGAGTKVCMLQISYNEKTESLWGWPLLSTAAPYLRSFQQFLRDRLSVAAAKAMYVRRKQVKGGSRAVQAVKSTLQSALSTTQVRDTNPPAVAGSTDIENEAITSTDLPMTTGASDAKTDGEMFSWTALLGAGVFPHYAGQGDSYRLATACYSEDTEVLTENGWKLHSDWHEGEKIACYDSETGEMNYLEPLDLLAYWHMGNMVHFTGRSINVVVTPNHKMLMLNENNVSKPWAKTEFEVREAQDLPSRFALPTQAKWVDGEQRDEFVLPGHSWTWGMGAVTTKEAVAIDMNVWVKFLGWWIAEGSLERWGRPYVVSIVQSKDSADANEIRELLDQLPFSFCEDEQRGMLRWRATSKPLYRWLEKHCGKGARNKRIPDFIFDLSVWQQKTLVEALWKGDGHSESHLHYRGCLTSTSPRLLDGVQQLLVHMGHWGKIALQRSENGHKDFKHSAACYVLHRNEQEKRSLSRRKNVQTVIDYEGMVYCFETPTGFYITRRKGCMLIAGNTSMEKPLQMQFSRYKLFLSAQFRRMVGIVLAYKELYGDVEFGEYTVEVSTDRLVEVDVVGLSETLEKITNSMLKPYIELGQIPSEVSVRILAELWRLVLQALGIETAGDIVSDETFGIGEFDVNGLEEGHPLRKMFGLLASGNDGKLREKVDPDTGKVVPRGKPLPVFEGNVEIITPKDVERAVAQWDFFMPEPYRGMLKATVVDEDELEND